METRSVGGQALVAAGLLLGFYALVAVVLVALVALNAAVLTLTGRLYWTVIAFSLLTAVALLRGVFSIARRDGDTTEGVEVSRSAEPRLWWIVDEIARVMGTHRPDEIRVVHDVNAWVSERGGLLGLRRGRRSLAVGLGLIQVLDVDQLRAVIAHELGHYARGDTLLGPLNYRAGASVQRTAEHLGSGTILGAVFAAYARLFLRVSLGVRRRQELGADAAAVRVAGRSAHASALRAVNAAGAAYGFFLERYAMPLWSRGHAPDDLYDGFRRLWEAPGRRDELAAVVEAAETATPHPLDSHPSLGERLALIETLPDRVAPNHHDPARSVLRDPEVLERHVTRTLSEQATGGPVIWGVAWDDAADRAFRPASVDAARDVLESVARVDGKPGPATVDRLLDVLPSDAVLHLAFELAGDLPGAPPEVRAEHQAAAVKDAVTNVVGCALVETAGASWRLSWSGPLDVVADGQVLAVHEWVEEAVDDPAKLVTLRERLREAGASTSWAPPRPPGREAEEGSDLVGVLAGVRHARKLSDGLVLVDALVVARAQATVWERVSSAIASSAGMSRGNDAALRIQRLLEHSMDEILAADADNRRIPWASVVSARLSRRLSGWRLRLLLDGGQVVTLGQASSGPSRKVVKETVGAVLGDRLAA